MERVHATCVAFRASRGWRALLLRGPSGSGKSDLALRLIDGGARLVSDDQTEIRRARGRLLATAPRTIDGLIEVRGVGIVRLTRDQLVTRVPLAVLVDLVPARQIERLPKPEHESLLGVELPRLAVNPFEPSAAAKMRLAFRQFAVA
ncbi:MAG: HPr kinase/phosphatase C-terminal domain-containing protein [Alphaproteobacteria bacterium]|nr:HPr kinase/phosphatase C-terminal domain-containing protein [Alphaproteobacteria bacterium]MBV8411269.1 HPr kinase/phosphatase C-terminal domain-containing protein [Alphaproteobacteria bacterium]